MDLVIILEPGSAQTREFQVRDDSYRTRACDHGSRLWYHRIDDDVRVFLDVEIKD